MEESTGVLASLKDTGLFAQIFINGGAIAWLGEIDPAPDAMHVVERTGNKEYRLI